MKSSLTAIAKKPYLLTAVLALAAVTGLALVSPVRVSASHPTIPAGVAPDWVRDIIHDKCINSGWNIVQLQWIAPQGSPAATSVSVPYDSPDVALTLNRITYRCKSSAHSYGSFEIVSTSPSISALNGMIGDMPYPAPNTYSTAALRDFNYPGPFTSDTTITLTLNSRGTTTYDNGTHFCAVVNTEPRRPTPHQHNFTPEPGYCVQSNSSFTIQVNVGPPPDQPPTGNMTATCDEVSGIAQDPDRPGDQIRVHLYVNGAYRGEYATDSSHRYSINVGSYKGFAANQFEVYAIGVDSAGNPNGVNPRIGNRTVGPCVPSVSCGTLTTSIGSPEANQPFTVRTRVNYSMGVNGTPPSRPTYTMTVSIPGIPYTENNASYSASSSGASFTTPSFSLSAGRYNATWTFRGPSVNATCTGSFIVVTKPYFRVYNGDVSAGLSLACPGWTSSPVSGTIIGHNDGSGRGSSVQLAAFAMATINGFTSATGRTSDPHPAKGLTFANTPSAGTFGGQFGVGHCPPDYFANRPAAATIISGSVDVGSLASGSYQANSDLTLHGTIQDGRNISIYVDGDVYITAAGVTNDGSWASIEDIPGFYLVAHGDIYIDAETSAIDGNYIAQPNGGAGGQIFTCAFGFRGPTESELINDCDHRLEVRGSLSARYIRLARTNGSLRSSSNSEPRSSSTIAEMIVFTPEVWLTSPVAESNPTDYEAITSLPPVL